MKKYLFYLSVFLSYAFYFIILVVTLPFIRDYKKRWILAKMWSREVLWAGGINIKEVTIKEDFNELNPVIFASNHASQMDIPILYTVINKPIIFIVKKELFDIPIFGFTLRVLGHIPIDRSGGKAALESLKEAKKRLDAGLSVVIFPEGTRSEDGTLGEFKKGAMLLAESSGYPVIPVAIKGSFQIMPKGKTYPDSGDVSVSFGSIFDPKKENLSKVTRDHFAFQIREEILRLLS